MQERASDQHEPPAPVDIDLQGWVSRLVARYPQIETIALLGSRAYGCPSPHSDYDVVLCLREDCYDAHDQAVERLEQRIAFDPAVRFDGLDLFFCRPSGALARWVWGPDEAPPRAHPDAPHADHINEALSRGDLLGDFSQLYRSLAGARLLYHAAPRPQEADGTAPQPVPEAPTLVPLPFPLPQAFLPHLGYRLHRRWVAVFWEPAGDEASWTDGEYTFVGADPWVYLELLGNAKVERWLRRHQLNLGNSEQKATHWLVVDQETAQGYVTERRQARDIVRTQRLERPG